MGRPHAHTADVVPPRDPEAVAALGGSLGAPVTTGGDYVCRERVFAPPTGTLDVDWLAPVVLDVHPGLDQPEARAAVVRAWAALQGLAAEAAAAGRSARPDEVPIGALLARLAAGRPDPSDLPGPDVTAARVVVEAVVAFRI